MPLTHTHRFEDLVSHLRDPAVVRVGRLLLQRVHHLTTGLAPPVPSIQVTRASVNPRVFLSGYMVRYHAARVFKQNPGRLEHELMEATAELLPAFHLIVRALDAGKPLLDKTDIALAAMEFPFLVRDGDYYYFALLPV